MKKMNKYLRSIQAEVNLLKNIINNPHKYATMPNSLLEILKNQNSFSNYEDTNLNILKYSLNSHKEYVKLYYDHPFEYLNKLRKDAYRLLKIQFNKDTKKSNKKNIINKKNYRININHSLENKLLSQNILLTSIIINLKEKLDFYVNKINSIEITKDYESTINEIEAMMSSINED